MNRPEFGRRLARVSKIAKQILQTGYDAGHFIYVARATEPVDGVRFPDLLERLFLVGVDDNDLTEVVFADLLQIFSIVQQVAEERVIRKFRPDYDPGIRVERDCDWTVNAASELLEDFSVETPFDIEGYLRLGN